MKIKQPNECVCSTCEGQYTAPNGGYGGMKCMCPCHKKPLDNLQYGVIFTNEQWEASNTQPPMWELNPPQREEFVDDQSYILEMRNYANRVIFANSDKTQKV